jgi:hypothetical protein
VAALVEGERRALLREAAELRDFLPRGVLRDQADLALINDALAGTKLAGGDSSGAPGEGQQSAAGRPARTG